MPAMEFKSVLFYIFSAVTVLAALRVITARNPVHAVLFLVLAFFNVAGLWMLLQAEFLSLVLIMVYVGAVMVLFLFVVMMLDINIERVRQGFWKQPAARRAGRRPDGGGDGAGAFRPLLRPGNLPPHQLPADYSNTKELARVLYTEYAYPFEIASVILLVAIIAAVMLTLRRRKDNKAMHSADQIAVKAADRMRLVKMTPEVELPPAGKGDSHDFAVALPDPRRHPVCHQHRRHLPQPEEPDRAADGHRTDAAGGEPEFRRLLALPQRPLGPALRVLHPGRGRRRVRIGLAILVVLFRNLSSIDVEDLDTLKG
jgi:NADH-quinone oxidoreductase subunit J